MKNKLPLLISKVILAIVLSVGFQMPTRSVAEEATLVADFGVALGPFNHAPGKALSATPGRSNFDEEEYKKLSALQLNYVRVWIRKAELFNDDTKKDTYVNNLTASCLKKYSPITQKILINFPFGSGYNDWVVKKKWQEAEYVDGMTRALEYYKRNFPKIEYVEIDNEPNAMKPAKYYFTYTKACSVVARMNAKITSGILPGPLLLVGGPTLYKFDAVEDQKWMQPFLDEFVADPSPDKRLDFIAYHEYLLREHPKTEDPLIYKDSPSRAANGLKLIDEALRKRGLPLVPIMVTEGGLFAGEQPDPTPSSDFFIKAAGQLALDYYFQMRKEVIPYRWTVDAIQPVKCFFVSTAEGKWTGESRPFYHATYFETQLPSIRYASQTRLDAKGMGVGTLAGGASNRVAVLVWNYQWTNSVSTDFTLRLTNLPISLRTCPVHVKMQAVRQGRDRGDAAVEVAEKIKPVAQYSRPIHLAPNEFVFVELSTITGDGAKPLSAID